MKLLIGNRHCENGLRKSVTRILQPSTFCVTIDLYYIPCACVIDYAYFYAVAVHQVTQALPMSIPGTKATTSNVKHYVRHK